jgi:hypothetical protein
MKPNFALILSSEVIGLLHRTSRGWLQVGEVPTESADLAAQLSYLRTTAQELSPQGISTKLILPADQILFTEVLAPGPEASQRRRQVRRALEGRTPYALDELVFDWWGTGDRVQVAAVAKETLEEAEAFATEHRFNPVSFVAIPPTSAFAGEPFFGQTKGAAKIVGAGESVGRDQDPVKIIAREPPPAPPPAGAEPVAETLPAAPEPDTEISAPAGRTRGAPAAETPAPAETEPEAPATPEAPAVPVPEATPAPERETQLPEAEPEMPVAKGKAAAAPQPEVAAEESEAVPEEEAAPEPLPAAATTAAAPPTSDADIETTAISTAVAALKARGAAIAPPPQALEDTAAAAAAFRGEPAPATVPLPAPDPSVPAPAFSSRRRDDLAGMGRPAVLPPAPEKLATEKPAAVAPPRPSGPKVTANVVPIGAPPPRTLPPLQTGSRAGKPKAATGSIAAFSDRRAAEGTSAAQKTVPPGRATAAAGSLGSRTVRQRGKPRYLGLVLTGALLLFLFLVAAWSSLYLAQNRVTPDEAETDVAAAAPEAEGEIDPEYAADLAAIGDTAAAPEAGPATAPDAEAEAIAAEVAGLVAAPAAPAETAAAGAPLPAEEAVASVAADPPAADPATLAASGAVQVPAPEVLPATTQSAPEPAPATGAASEAAAIAVPGVAGQDEIFLARIDEAPPVVDPLVLPAASAADAAPAAQMPPPPFGTTYAFDDGGRIVAPPAGVVTPDGVWLVAARPPVLPPPRPAAAETAAATPGPEPLPDPATAAVTGSGFAPDPDAATLRPNARPATAPQQAEDDAGLQPASDTRLAALRPQVRPAVLATATADAAGASLFAASAIPDNPQAVIFSRRPAPRPQDFTGAVEAAVAAAVRPDEPAAETSNPDLSPEERAEDSGDDEPSAAPRIPTSASVAREATFANAINLSKINLIGIYGTASNRSALVRLASGRYVKVEVGDRVDGGRVAAITTSELRYQKGGRLVTLKMPRG